VSWIVAWNGRDYDIDPGEFTGRELGEVKKRVGLTFTELMFDALPKFDADAIRAVFWIVDRRDDSTLKFDDYDGPPMKVYLAGLAGWAPLAEAMGKAVNSAVPDPTGSDGSESSTDIPLPNLDA